MSTPSAGGQPPPASHSQFQFVASSGITPARWIVASDSVVAKALKFLGWQPNSSATRVFTLQLTIYQVTCMKSTPHCVRAETPGPRGEGDPTAEQSASFPCNPTATATRYGQSRYHYQQLLEMALTSSKGQRSAVGEHLPLIHTRAQSDRLRCAAWMCVPGIGSSHGS